MWGFNSIAHVAAIQFVSVNWVRLISRCPHKHVKWGFHKEQQYILLSWKMHNKHTVKYNSQNTKNMESPKSQTHLTALKFQKSDVYHHLASRVELCFLHTSAKRQISHCPLLPHNETRLEQHQAAPLFSQRTAEIGVGSSPCRQTNLRDENMKRGFALWSGMFCYLDRQVNTK